MSDKINQLKKEKAEIERKIAAAKKEERVLKLAENKKKLDVLRANKDVLLSLLSHSRTSCSDDNISNGYGSASYGARCNKCHLIEILNDEDNNEFKAYIDIVIVRV